MNVQKTLEVSIEKGMKNQENIVFPRESEQHPDLIPGDLIVVIQTQRHSFFHSRINNDLYADMTLSFKEAMLGYNRGFTHLDNREVRITSSTTTQPFSIRQIVGEGMPVHNFASSKGDLHLNMKVRLPSRLSEEEKKLIQEFL